MEGPSPELLALMCAALSPEPTIPSSSQKENVTIERDLVKQMQLSSGLVQRATASDTCWRGHIAYLSIPLINLGHAMAGAKPEHMDTKEEGRFWNSTFRGLW